MKYGSKRDAFFVVQWILILLLMNFVFLSPILFDDVSGLELLVVIGFDVLFSAFIIWLALDIRYVLFEDYLFVKGGMFRSKIQYKDITKISGKPNLWVGYRILFSRDAIEIYYKTGIMGSVVISPKDKASFIQQLVQCNNRIQLEGMDGNRDET
ncbi:PH domain-containing protein [Paenibacillus sp. TRM 82003]|nr:PH domain-containing protein [Paenibacillus sp. TRM 82003]